MASREARKEEDPEFFEQREHAYVLRVASTFMLTLNAETRLTCGCVTGECGITRTALV